MDLQERVDQVVRALHAGPAGRSLRVSTLTVSQGSQTIEHRFGDAGAADLRSVSKTVFALAVGVALDRGERLGGVRLTVDLPVEELLVRVPDIAGIERADAWREVTVAHLLSNTVGHHTGFFFRGDVAGRDPARLLDYVFASPLVHSPGTHFAYSNAGWFLLSVVVQELSGQRLSGWIRPRLLEPLGIRDVDWRRYGPYDAGGTGLRLGPQELHRLADLLRHDGLVGDVRVVSTDWCRALTRDVVPTPDRFDPTDPLPKSGYGYGIWTTGDGRYFGDGTDGQYLIVDPVRDLAITVLADEPDMRAIRRCLVPLLR